MTPAEIREMAKHWEECGAPDTSACLTALADLVEACEMYPHSVADALPACVAALARVEKI